MSITNNDPNIITFRMLPFLDRADVLNFRLVNSESSRAVDELMGVTRGWMDDLHHRRGGLLIRQSVQNIPRCLSDLKYMFRLFQEASRLHIQSGSYLGLPPPSLGISLEKVKESEDQLSMKYSEEFRKGLSSEYQKQVVDDDSFESMCKTILNFPLPRASLTPPLPLVQIMEFAVRQDCVRVLDTLINTSHFTSIPQIDLQNTFILAAKFGSRSCLDRLMKSSRGIDIQNVLYEALTIAKMNQHWQCVDLLAPPIQKSMLKSYAIGCAHVIGKTVATFFLNTLHKDICNKVGDKNGFLGYAASLFALVGHVGIGVMSQRLFPRPKYLFLVEHLFYHRIAGRVYSTWDSPNVSKYDGISGSMIREMGRNAVLYGVSAICALPILEKIFLARNIYPIVTAGACLIQAAVRKEWSVYQCIIGPLVHGFYLYMTRLDQFR